MKAAVQYLSPFLLFYFTSVEGTVPRGHNEMLGFHRPSDGHIDIIEKMLKPQDFWEQYCSIGKPMLLKGAAMHWPAITRWTDDYIWEKYGDLRVKLESKYEKDFKPEGDRGMGQDSVRQFLSTYRNQDKYMVSQLPDQMATEVAVPQCLLCGSFRSRILEANIWMSAGNTKSLLHRDADNAINCLLNGTKDWILIDPKYEDYLPVAVEPGTPYGGYTLINVDKVDLLKFSKFQEVPWTYANVSAGDCLFLPKGYWHQVRSYGSKNLAVSILFSRINQFEQLDCPGSGLPPVEMLSEVPMVWKYDGVSVQTMGNTDPFELNETMEELCKEGSGKIDSELLDRYLLTTLEFEEDEYRGSLDLTGIETKVSEENQAVIMKRKEKLMNLLDDEKKGYYDCKNLPRITVEQLKQLAEIMDPDPANTEEYEYLHLSEKVVSDMIHASVGLVKERFIDEYIKSGGSRTGSRLVFDILDDDEDGFISSLEIQRNLAAVLDKYKENALTDVFGDQAADLHQASPLSERDEL